MRKLRFVWLTISAAIAMPGIAQAQDTSAKLLFEKYKLIGTFAFDCSKPPADNNRYYVHRVMPTAHVQRDMMSGPTTRDFAVIWAQGQDLTGNQIALTGTRDGQPLTSTYLIEGNRLRVMESTVAGKKEIEGGRFVGSGPTPWANRCPG
jgi:hypothetical protein